uniref:Enolpyruvate transferase domain-containing protein n=1 Tax=Vitis vinifera TaxID=29760 RepID=F6HRC2_VITVI
MSSVLDAPVDMKCYESLLFVAAGSSVSTIDLRTMQRVMTTSCGTEDGLVWFRDFTDATCPVSSSHEDKSSSKFWDPVSERGIGTSGLSGLRDSSEQQLNQACQRLPGLVLGFVSSSTSLSPTTESKYNEKTEIKDAGTVESKLGVVAADDGRCSGIGAFMLRKGGLAVNAEVATAWRVGIFNPMASGIGGRAFMIVQSSSTLKSEAFGMRETAPLVAPQNMYENNPRAKYLGTLAMGVLKEIAGLRDAGLKHGRLVWRSLFQPAIRLAKYGYMLQMGSCYKQGISRLEMYEVDNMKRLRSSPQRDLDSNAGTVMRPLIAAVTAAGGDASYVIDGVLRMRETSIGDLVTGLKQLGADVNGFLGTNCSPVRVNGNGGLPGGKMKLFESKSILDCFAYGSCFGSRRYGD